MLPVFVHALWDIGVIGSRRERNPDVQRALFHKVVNFDIPANRRCLPDTYAVGFGTSCAELLRTVGLATIEVPDALPSQYPRRPDHWWHKLEAIRIVMERTGREVIWLDFDTVKRRVPDSDLEAHLAAGPAFQGSLRMHRNLKCPWVQDARRQVEMFHGGCYYFRNLATVAAALDAHRQLQSLYPLYASDENATTFMVDNWGIPREDHQNLTLYARTRTLANPYFLEGGMMSRAQRIAAMQAEPSKLRISRYELPQLIDAMRLTTGVEVGVHLGEFSYHLLSQSSLSHLTSVDAWPGKNAQYRAGAESLLSEFGKRSRVLAFSSAEAVKQVESVDLVYVDASHRYPDVAADLRTWAPKVNKGGILAGHDYCDAGSGVVRAVNEFAKATRRQLFLTREKWASWLFFM